MTADALHFVAHSDQDRGTLGRLPPLAEADQVDVRVRTKDGEEHTLAVPQAALGFIDAPLAHSIA